MLSANDNSYMKEYVRRSRARSSRGGAENVRPGGAAGERLLTDRGEYIKFLESQLDAVTQACLTAQSFDERIVSLGAAAVAHDEKILNLARLIKCSQGVAEEQESAYSDALKRVHDRVRECERVVGEVRAVEDARVLDAGALLRDKGLAGGGGGGGGGGGPGVDPSDQKRVPRSSFASLSSSSARPDGVQLSLGVLDAQFRAWADGVERKMDARLDRLEKRLASRVDAAAADALDATRHAERRLREDAPRLAQDAARRLWGAAGGDRGAFPPRGGVAGAGDLAAALDRVGALEANEDEHRATLRSVRELQATQQRAIEEARDRERRRERREARGEGFFEGPGAGGGGGGEESFSGFWADRGGAPGGLRGDNGGGALSEALARSVEASARGFERLDAQFAELRARLDAREAEASRTSAAIESLRRAAAKAEAVSYRGGALSAAPRPGETGDRRPAAMIMAEAEAIRHARSSMDRAFGLTRRDAEREGVKRGEDERAEGGARERRDEDSDEEEGYSAAAKAAAASARLGSSSAADANRAPPRAPTLADETDARRAKLKQLYERLDDIVSPGKQR